MKSKRSVVRPIEAEIRRRFQVSIAEVEDAELYQRARLGVSVVSGDRAYIEQTLTRVEEMVARRPEIELLSSKMRLVHSADFSRSRRTQTGLLPLEPQRLRPEIQAIRLIN